MKSFEAGVVTCDALKRVKSECSLDLADFGHHCLYRRALFHDDLADDLPVRHLGITEIQVNNIANDFEATWNLNSRGKNLLQHLLEAIVFVVESELVSFVHLKLLLLIVFNKSGRPDNAPFHKNKFVTAIIVNW